MVKNNDKEKSLEKATADRIETTLLGRQIDDALLSTWISNGGSTTRTEITQTFYDNQQGPNGVISQRNTKKRVTAVYYMDVHTALSVEKTLKLTPFVGAN